MELQRPLGVGILSAVAFIYFCGTMRLAFSLACKGENAERIKSEARNMSISDLPCGQIIRIASKASDTLFSLACKGENAERIKSEARNMKISDFI